MSYSIQSATGGLGSLGAVAPCPLPVSTDVPPGLSPGVGADGGSRQICGPNYVNDPIAKLCNMSGNPGYCYYAKKNGKALLGRGTVADVAKWVAWQPAWGTSAAPDAGTPAGGATAASDNTMLYVGIGAAALILGGAVYWRMKS